MTTSEQGSILTANSATKRETVFSSSLWEPQMGYARGVRVGNQIFVAGTVASDGEGRAQGDDAYQQTDFIIRKIQGALQDLGGDLEHVVSTVTHLSDFTHFDDYCRAHKEHFGGTPPVNTTIQAQMVRPHFLVEVTATAIVPEG
ncbi:RidA family protein [Streptomyces kronopolitis]|uniref:RidA family protein n=1 Tax=Streptomyces kronopolitis TaxID=1612435 RepID=UPI0020C12B3A|nr:RidA family protein [Streptomyces kronopolitis]MCL6298910.1 RidA family protein [Streptomyces kronopolitis]